MVSDVLGDTTPVAHSFVVDEFKRLIVRRFPQSLDDHVPSDLESFEVSALDDNFLEVVGVENCFGVPSSSVVLGYKPQ